MCFSICPGTQLNMQEIGLILWPAVVGNLPEYIDNVYWLHCKQAHSSVYIRLCVCVCVNLLPYVGNNRNPYWIIDALLFLQEPLLPDSPHYICFFLSTWQAVLITFMKETFVSSKKGRCACVPVVLFLDRTLLDWSTFKTLQFVGVVRGCEVSYFKSFKLNLGG